MIRTPESIKFGVALIKSAKENGFSRAMEILQKDFNPDIVEKNGKKTAIFRDASSFVLPN